MTAESIRSSCSTVLLYSLRLAGGNPAMSSKLVARPEDLDSISNLHGDVVVDLFQRRCEVDLDDGSLSVEVSHLEAGDRLLGIDLGFALLRIEAVGDEFGRSLGTADRGVGALELYVGGRGELVFAMLRSHVPLVFKADIDSFRMIFPELCGDVTR
jgi:hypothetical protein